MDEQTFLDFLSALGEEFCGAMSPPVPFDLITPQDGYEVWLRTFDSDPTPAAFANITSDGIAQLVETCAEYLECEQISDAHVKEFISRTLARWPENNS